MEFPEEKYKDFKIIKLPYSQAHENKARREFYGSQFPKRTLSIERDILEKGLDINEDREIRYIGPSGRKANI